MSLIRGVLLAGQFRTHHELNDMSPEDQRNTLIVELSNRSNQKNFQAFNDTALADAGAALVFLRAARIRDDAQLKTMTIDDMRNTLIVEIGAMTGMGQELQGLSNMDLVLRGLGDEDPGVTLRQPSFIRGVLLAGKFRTQHELNKMSRDDQRNTLIVELSNRTKKKAFHFQAMDDYTLAGTGAVLVFLREAKIRNDAELKAMSDNDQRNTLIVEINGQTQLDISRLQGASNMNLVRLGLGVDAEVVFKPLLRPGGFQTLPFVYVFSIDSIEILVQKSDNAHSDSDWLTIIPTIADPITKNIRTLPEKTHHLGGEIHFGDILRGPFESDPIDAKDTDVVIVNYFVTNLGSSDDREQFAQAVKVTNKVVGVVGPAAGAAVGFLYGDPAAGAKIGKAIADAFDGVIKGLGEFFDAIGVEVADANCNGMVLQDTLVYNPHEVGGALGQKASRQYLGPQEESDCGDPPMSKVNFSIHKREI
jgi:hypothetical protein